MGGVCSCFGNCWDDFEDVIDSPNNFQQARSHNNGYTNFVSEFSAFLGTKKAMPLPTEEPQDSKEEEEDDNDDDDYDDENCCPTCLHKYTTENPKITAKCSHHYHLPCIFAWQERSNLCPACNRVMEFDEFV